MTVTHAKHLNDWPQGNRDFCFPETFNVKFIKKLWCYVATSARSITRWFSFINWVDNKHLTTGPTGNIEFCFPETLNVPPRETLRSRGNKTHCFPRGQSSTVLLYLPTQKYKKLRRNRLLYAGWLTNLLRFQGARHDHMRVESLGYCFPRELVSFDPWNMACFPPIGKRIWLERYNNVNWPNRFTVVNSHYGA